MQIEELREAGEDGGSLMGYFAKGHHDRRNFADAVNQHTNAKEGYDVRYVRADRCRHEWWQTALLSEEPGSYQYIAAEPQSQCGFAVTVCDDVYTNGLNSAIRKVDADRAGQRRGFAEGLNWALRTLETINPEAGKELLSRYQATPPE